MIGQVLLEGFGLGVLLMLVCITGYLAYVLVFTYAVNGALLSGVMALVLS